MPGPTGGYALARDPGDISFLEVIEIAEGSIGSGRCALRGGTCSSESVCALHERWVAAQSKLAEALDAVTFAELAR